MPIMTSQGTARAHRCTIILTFLLLLVAWPLFAACSSIPAAQANVTTLCAASTATTLPSTARATLLSVWPTLQQSAKAMLALSSAQSQFQGSATFAVRGPGLPASTTTILARLEGSGTASRALHEEYAAARLSLQRAQGAPKTVAVSELLSGGKLYLQRSPGRRVVLDLSRVATLLQAKVGTLLFSQNLLALAGHVTVDDHGICLYAGQSARHLTLWLDGAWLDQDASTSDTSAGMSVDLLLEQHTSLLLRLQVKGLLQFHLATSSGQPSFQGNQPRMLQASFNLNLSFSHFNQRVAQFVAPPEATPVDMHALLTS